MHRKTTDYRDASSEILPGPASPRTKVASLSRALALAAAILMSALAPGQSVGNPPPTGPRAPVPLPHLYWHFLVHQDHLDRAAAVREKQGKDGGWLRNHYQQKLGFTDAEFVPVRQTAQRLEAELNVIDAKVQAIVNAARAAHPRVLKSASDLPALPPELLALRDQHEAVIEREAANLKSALGPDRTAKLEAFLQNQFARNVTAHVMNPPRPGNPTKTQPGVFRKEVQP